MDYFQGKTYLVTGASSGIGLAVCKKLALCGANLILVGRSEERLVELAQSFANTSCLCIKVDLQDVAALEDKVTQIWNWQNGLDGLAYCAGLGLMLRLRDTTLQLLVSRMMVHCFAFVELLRRLARLKKKGRLLQIVAFSSLAARGQDKYLVGYAASKGALEAAAKTMAAELLPKNILINLVRCAFVDTPMVTGPSSDPQGDFIERLEGSGSQPLGIIPPEIAAEAAMYLLGPGSVYSTGTTLTINAGAKI